MRTLIIVLLLFLPSMKALSEGVHSNALQRFDVEDLEIVEIGKCKSTGYPYAYILDADGYRHKVNIDDFLGRNLGKIKKIDSCGLWFREIREIEVGDWGNLDRLLLDENAPLSCTQNLPENIKIVEKEKSQIMPQKQIENKAFRIFLNLHGFNSSNLQAGSYFSIPLISGVHSFFMDGKWIVTVWDEFTDAKKVKVFVFVFSERGNFIKYFSNGPEPDY